MLFIFESIKRRILAERAVRRNDIEKAFLNATKRYLKENRGIQTPREIERISNEILDNCNRDLRVILLGSSAKYSATPESDIELFIYSEKFASCGEFHGGEYWDFIKFLKEEIAKKLGMKRRVEGREKFLVDLRVGTPDLIAELARRETERARRERGAFWTFTPATDGILVGDVKRDMIADLIPEVSSVARRLGKGQDLYEWGIKQYRESLDVLLRGIGEDEPEKLYRYFDLLIRGVAIRESRRFGTTSFREFKTKPYWLLFDSKLHLRGRASLRDGIKRYLIGTILFRAKLRDRISYEKRYLRRFVHINLPISRS